MSHGCRFVRAAGVLSFVVFAAACGNGARESSGFEVSSEVVSHETTQEVLVFSPDAEGSWPVIFALHGIDGAGKDMAVIGRRIAREGFVVFAPTYRSDLSTLEGLVNVVNDVECAYRFTRSIADEHGGDLDQPVTIVGWSLGATLALAGGLSEDITDPTGEPVSCFPEVPRPEVVVAISGCHYEFQGAETDPDLSRWGNKDADVTLVAGEKDTVCAPWQSDDAADELRAAGYGVHLVMIQGASHYAPIFHDLLNGKWSVEASDPAGERTVEVIIDAIEANRDRS